MMLRALAILFSLLAHVVFGYALWFRPQSDELEVLDVGNGQEFSLTPVGSTVSAVSASESAESIESEQAINLNQKQSLPQPSALAPADSLRDTTGSVASEKSQEGVAFEDQKPSSTAVTAVPAEGLPDVVSSENGAPEQIQKTAELLSEAPAEQKTEDGVASMDSGAKYPLSELAPDENVGQVAEKQTPDNSLEPEQPSPSDPKPVPDAGNSNESTPEDRHGEMLSAEDRSPALLSQQPNVGAFDEQPGPTAVDQPKGAESNGNLALDQLDALKPGALEVLARPQQVALMTGTGSDQAEVSDPALIGEYLDSINERVQSSKINPRTQSTGTVVLKYTVGTDGSLLSMIVISTSGSSVLDGAAISAIHKAAPFPIIPRAVSAKPMTFLQPFKFVLR